MPRTFVALAALGIALAVPARAQEAAFELSTSAVLWSGEVVAHIWGTGCSGETTIGEPFWDVEDDIWQVYIDLWQCDDLDEEPFETSVVLGGLDVGRYEVRLYDAIHGVVTPPIPPFAVAPLSVHRRGDLQVAVEAPALAGEVLTLEVTFPAQAGCFGLAEPQIEGAVVSTHLVECEYLPPGEPGVYSAEVPLGPLAPGSYEVRVFDRDPEASGPPPAMSVDELEVFGSDDCIPGPETLCLQEGRFAAEVTWTDFAGASGPGRAVPLADRDSSGLFWFFTPDNVELSLKVLDGCAENGAWWVFLGSSSTVEFEVAVTDLVTGSVWRHVNGLGEAAALVADTAAFGCEAGP